MKKLILFFLLTGSIHAAAAWTPVAQVYRNGTTGQLYCAGVATYPPGFQTPTNTPTPTNTFTPTNTPTNTPTATSTPTPIPYCWEKIGSTQTASASATINFTGFSGTYRDFMVIGSDVVPATDAAVLWMRVSLSGTFQTGGSDYKWRSQRISGTTTVTDDGDVSDSEIQVFGDGTMGSDTSESSSFIVTIFNPASTANFRTVNIEGAGTQSSGAAFQDTTVGQYIGSLTAVDGVQFLFSSGDIESGTFTLYGRRN